MVYSRTGNQFFRENDGTSHMLVGGNIGKIWKTMVYRWELDI